MQCPNCKRTVRSTTQCAHCGTVFEDLDVNTNEEKPVATSNSQEKPKKKPTQNPRSKTKVKRFFSGIWSVVKLILLVVIVFLLFLFAPRFITKLMNKEQNDQTQLVQNQPQETSQILQSDSIESSDELSQEEEAGYKLVSSKVDLDDYPTIKLDLEFSDLPDNIDSDTFDFQIQTDGQADNLGKEYSLIKDGNKLIISYNDPSALVSASPKKQNLVVKSNQLSFEDNIEYELPVTSVDQEHLSQFNQIITDNLSSQGKVSALLIDKNKNTPLIYDSQTSEASSLISWFVLARTYEAVEKGELEFSDTVEIIPDLIPAGDQGLVAQAENGQISLAEIIDAVISGQDVAGMNHLIQVTGGANKFNLWLSESDYFATKVTSQLEISDSGNINGAVTNPQDLAKLMLALADHKLISEEMDEVFRQDLLMTPLSEKYPSSGISQVVRRFEITSTDTNADNQYYSAILETDETDYIIIIMLNGPTDPDSSVAAIAQTVSDLVTYFETGQIGGGQEEQEEVVEDDGVYRDEQGRTQSQQLVTNTGEYILLPDVYNEDGSRVEWFKNESGGYNYR